MENFRDVISKMENKSDGSRKFREYFWHTVFESLDILNEIELRFVDYDFIAKFLLASLRRYGCNNTGFIREILGRYAIQLHARYVHYSSAHSLFSVPFLAQHVHFLLSSGCLNHIISYKDVLTGVVNSVDLAMQLNEQDFIICFVKHGLFLSRKIDLKEVIICVDLFILIWSYMNNRIAIGEPLIRLILDFLSYISHKHPRFPVKRPKTHVVFILRIILAIILKLTNAPRTEKYVNCIKLLYRIIPEPYVPRDDVKDLLLYLLQFVNGKEKIIEKYLATYVELFGAEDTASYIPRSLKHLTRCVIRNEIIKSSQTVQTAVHRMCLPETLKQLLVGAPE